jgi:hypothetical protein
MYIYKEELKNAKPGSGPSRQARFPSRSRPSSVAGAGEDGETRVFGESGIGLGELAEEELGAFAGFDKAGVEATGAKAEPQVGFGG